MSKCSFFKAIILIKFSLIHCVGLLKDLSTLQRPNINFSFPQMDLSEIMDNFLNFVSETSSGANPSRTVSTVLF